MRGAQFAARFGMSMEEKTAEICSAMDISSLSRERVEGELEKALLKADRPSVFFEVLRQIGQLDCWFPEVKDLIGIEQDEKHHPEGDVWRHTMLVLDEGAKYRERCSYPKGFMMTCLVHDFGKVVCTETINGVIHSYGHETKGLPIVRRFLKRLTSDGKLISFVINMTENHMRPNINAAAGSSVKATNRMYDSVEYPEDLVWFSQADSMGRHPEYLSFLQERLRVYHETMSRPYVTGKDLIEAGLRPDTDFRELLEYAHKLRLAGVEKEPALKQTIAFSRKMK